eukprot:g9135.t1
MIAYLRTCCLTFLAGGFTGSILQQTVSVQYHKFDIFETDGPHVRSLYTNQVSVLEVLIGQRVGLSYNQYPPIVGQNSYWIAAVEVGGVTGCAILHYDQKGVEVQVPADWNLTDLSSGSQCISVSLFAPRFLKKIFIIDVNYGQKWILRNFPRTTAGFGAGSRICSSMSVYHMGTTPRITHNFDRNCCGKYIVTLRVTFIRPRPAQSILHAWRMAISTTCYYPDGSVTVVSSGPTQYREQPSKVLLYAAAKQGRDPKNTSWVAANGFTNVVVLPDGFKVFCNITANFGRTMNGPHPWHQHGITWLRMTCS